MNSPQETVKPVNATKNMTFCALFTVLIVVGAYTKIPLPMLPFTLQFLFTTMAGLILGPGLGAASVGLYAVLGLAGLPVFTEGGGIWYIFKPTFGYILGFIAGAWITGKVAGNSPSPSFKRLLAADFAGLAVVYTMGMVWYFVICNFVINTPIGVLALFFYCFVLDVPGDIALCFLAAVLAKRLRPTLRKMLS